MRGGPPLSLRGLNHVRLMRPLPSVRAEPPVRAECPPHPFIVEPADPFIPAGPVTSAQAVNPTWHIVPLRFLGSVLTSGPVQIVNRRSLLTFLNAVGPALASGSS